MHLSSTRTGLKVDADNIPELGGFLSRDFGSKYHNLYIKLAPCKYKRVYFYFGVQKKWIFIYLFFFYFYFLGPIWLSFWGRFDLGPISPRFLCRPTTLYIIARAVERLQQLYKSRYTTEESRTRGRFDWKSLQGPKRLTDPDLEYFPHSKFRPAHSKCGERHSYDQIETETYWLLITKCKLMQNYLFCKHILHTSTDNSLNVTKNWIYKNIWILTFLLPKSLTLVIFFNNIEN